MVEMEDVIHNVQPLEDDLTKVSPRLRHGSASKWSYISPGGSAYLDECAILQKVPQEGYSLG